MEKKSVKLAAVGVLMIGLSLFVSCNKKKAAEGGIEYTLKMGKQVTNPFISPLVQIADEHKFFEEYNLGINIELVDRSGSFEAVSVGKLDFITFELVPHLTYGAQGSDEILFGGTLTGGMAVMANKNV